MSAATDDPQIDDQDPDEQDDVEPAGPDDPEGPDLGDDDHVDVDEDMVAAVAGGDEEESDDDQGVDDEQDQSSSDESGSKTPTETLTTGTSVGDMYCNALGMAAATTRESYGSGVSDRTDAMEEYADDARQIGLDDFVNEWMQEQGGFDEMSPGQGIVIGTAMFAMGVMIEDPALAENIAEEVGA
ncbi:hypothetical protein [Halapricum desulfuricans]|uniref:Uncharacterized protein n=1 Tax=Halapricum desulfuricans TaxID=2841257 RepID=A0A897MWG6_9EURY|nr:hypothetical protein [Halapricum desulfuricans]QSG06460.1 hypothetical protein HSR121_2129 [Halapricum desulfuricans]